MYCTKCGHEAKDNEKYCGNCGNFLESDEEINLSKEDRGPDEDPKKPKRKNSKWIIAVVLVIIFVVGGYLGIKYFSPEPDDKRQALGNNSDSETKSGTDSETEREPAFPKELTAFGRFLFEGKWLENNTYYVDDPDSVTFLIVDLNQDGIKELAVFQEYGDFTANGEVTTYLLVYDKEQVRLDNIGGSYYGYSLKYNYLLTGSSHGGINNTSAYTLNENNSIENVYSLRDNKGEAPPYTFTINEEEVTERKYDSLIASFEVNNTGEYEPERFSSENLKTHFNIQSISKGEVNKEDLVFKAEEVMDGETCTFYVRANTSNGDKVWERNWKDIIRTELPTASDYKLYEDMLLIAIQGEVYSLDIYTGDILWHVYGGAGGMAPVIDNSSKVIYMAGYYDGTVTAISLQGSILWTEYLPKDIYWPYNITISNNVIIVYCENAICSYDKEGGAVDISYKPDVEDVSNIYASSVLDEYKGIVYYPNNIIDGNMKTAWVENVSGYGEGEYIEIFFMGSVDISQLQLINGYSKSQELYYKNNRAKKIRITFSNGEYIESTLEDGILDFQNIYFDRTFNTYSIKITILEAYPGSHYDDTCISEVRWN